MTHSRFIRAVSVLVVTALSVVLLRLPAQAEARPRTTTSITQANDALPEPHGLKSWLIKQALELIALGIRKGGKVVQELISWMDAKAAKAFRKHAHEIADALDEIAKIPDLSRRIVKEKLFVFLTRTLELNPGTAQVITSAVDGVLAVLI